MSLERLGVLRMRHIEMYGRPLGESLEYKSRPCMAAESLVLPLGKNNTQMNCAFEITKRS